MKNEFEWDGKSPKSESKRSRKQDEAIRRRILEEKAAAIKLQLDLKLSESAERCDFTDTQLNELSNEYENLLLDINELESALFDEDGGEDN